MIRWIAIGLLLLGTTALAQDPLQTLPDAYKLQFENEYVKVVRVHYDAGVKLPEHAHPPGATVYIYLNDSEGVLFRHVGTMSHVTRRPPVMTGSIRVSTGVEEHHEAENTAGTASDFLRILLKTEVGSGRRGGRLSPSQPEFTNGQMRITRLRVEPHQSVTIGGAEPALVLEIPSGKEHWVDPHRSETISNPHDRALDLVRVDLLSARTM